MKKGLSLVFYPFLWILGAFSVLGGNSTSMTDLVLLKKDIERDSSYDGQAIFDQIEGIKG
ncbi:hypothetical protein Q9R46_14995 [Paenibacillus sp. RRE4]|uniref:hypothetical protein n=1 Tax=Paenibacillus sp. RRE4 TaxID=2962587 RepID=UPI0028813E48|nr:hypothetical protein [Paenibacillus sp. RRE4]MDT0123964.1 hypothetical protein [Paenibacillus sp. RRE4]